ncbi:MAG: hypothetical protein J5752_07505 [Clostridiales bacterium]|nr:hypothetical protein [Clostridiales bacterium]
MKTFDKRLTLEEVNLLKSFVGKCMTLYSHDEFIYSSSSSQAIEIVVENVPYYLYSFVESEDYFGTTEDVAAWTFTEEKLPIIESKTFVKTPVNDIIQKITMIQENQRLYENGKQTYDVWVTRGIVFDFGDRQIAFEKDVWFSEEIIVHRGYNLIECFSSVDGFGENWDKSVKAECTRTCEIIEND